MPRIDLEKAVRRRGSPYPKPFRPECEGREKIALGDVAGLTQFGVNIASVEPGAASAVRHWHEQEDEFIYMLEGELILEENDGETLLRPGDAAAFKAGSGNAHRLLNRSGAVAVYLEVGTRAASERVHYPDVDLVLEREHGVRRFMRRSGELYNE